MVWVDFLDGIKEYIEGFFDNVIVFIGIVYEGKVIVGVIN